MKKEIAIILPYKEIYSDNYAGAASIWIKDYDKAQTLCDDLEILYDYFKSNEISENELNTHFKKCSEHIESVEFKNMLSNEGDEMSAVIQITAGAGGTESCDWA